MGLSTISCLASKLVINGLSPSTPTVAVERGTTPQQRTVFAELKHIAAEVNLANLVSPTLIIVGQVVALSPLWPHSTRQDSLLYTQNG
ncbi:hypothetical protein AXF42_Ash021235 [Apostasia shenzhenica]|uniref:Uroporphyrinogen-III C-methyltransferase n=1 Tax=Apostasia shenzhenica TaxID=1088818 RepID=A0A2I0BCU2_9ASPA|nr:hypothetical protein AXF42_Ash021235 [Apostasia shenzhenica]